jgi:hypothetical protein
LVNSTIALYFSCIAFGTFSDLLTCPIVHPEITK